MRRDTIPATGRPPGASSADPNMPSPPEVPAHEKEVPAAPPEPAPNKLSADNAGRPGLRAAFYPNRLPDRPRRGDRSSRESCPLNWPR